MENSVDLIGRTASGEGGGSERSKTKRQRLPKSKQRLSKSEQLGQENERLRARLEEAEAALEAIRSGGVDALVISSDGGDQVFTLQGAEHPYRVMVETMNEGAATLLEDGTILYANPRLADIIGSPVETLIGSSILDYIVPEDFIVFDGLVEQGFRSSCRAEIRFCRSDRSSIPVLISFSPTQAEGAQALCLVVTDLTEQRRNEEILAAERLTRSILEQAAEVILVCDTGGKIIRANQKALEIFSRNPIYKDFEAALPLIYHDPDGNNSTFSIASILAGGSFQEIEAEYRPEYPSSQGEKRFFLVSAAPLVKDQDQIIGCIVTLSEMTERKRANEALRTERAKLEAIVENLDVGVMITDKGGTVLSMNPAALKMHGFSSPVEMYTRREQFENVFELSDPDGRIVPPEEWTVFSSLDGSFFKDLEMQVRDRRTGRKWIGCWSVSPVRNHQGEVELLIFSVRDITSSKRAETALRESEQKFRMLFENSPDAVFITIPDGSIAAANPAACAMFGMPEQEICGLGHSGILDVNDPRLAAALEERRGTGRIQAHELTAIRKNGERFPVEVDSVILQDAPVLSFVIMRNITERKRAEEALRKSEATLREYAEKLERSNQELQDFAFIASHDMQEPLRKITSFSKMIGIRSNLNETDRDHLRRLQDATRRMQNMIDDLLELSRVTTRSKPYERVDLNLVAKTVLDDLDNRIHKSNGQVILHPLPVIEADAIQMHQLLQNLVGNAVKYHRADAPPCVQVGYRESSPGWVEIFVQDNGIGFDIKYAEQIFQPFRRLHGRGEYEGSGIGLAICRKIAERHGGRITAQSIPGEGSMFFVVLPVKQARG